MDNKLFFSKMRLLKKLYKNPNTFSNRWQIRKTKKELNKLIKKSAKEQAIKTYQQVIELYNNILDTIIN